MVKEMFEQGIIKLSNSLSHAQLFY